MRRRCKRCGAYLDPGEWCDCEEQKEQSEIPEERPHRPHRVAKDRTEPYSQDAYVERRWRAWYEN